MEARSLVNLLLGVVVVVVCQGVFTVQAVPGRAVDAYPPPPFRPPYYPPYARRAYYPPPPPVNRPAYYPPQFECGSYKEPGECCAYGRCPSFFRIDDESPRCGRFGVCCAQGFCD